MGPRETILESIAEHKLDFEEPVKNTIIVTLPGIKKLQTYCVLIIGQHSLSINAFPHLRFAVVAVAVDGVAGARTACCTWSPTRPRRPRPSSPR
jgi:hypothetical protein